jgi:hypothetical protein
MVVLFEVIAIRMVYDEDQKKRGSEEELEVPSDAVDELLEEEEEDEEVEVPTGNEFGEDGARTEDRYE